MKPDNLYRCDCCNALFEHPIANTPPPGVLVYLDVLSGTNLGKPTVELQHTCGDCHKRLSAEIGKLVKKNDRAQPAL